MRSPWVSRLIVFAVVGAVALASTAQTDAQGNDLRYFGGPIMGNPTVYTIFWLPSGHHFERDTTRDAAYEGLINGFIKDLDGSPYFKVLDQYSTDPTGKAITGGPIAGHVTLGGTWVDTAPYPHSGTQDDPVMGADVQSQIESAMRVNGWTAALNKIYFVYLGANVNYCSLVRGPCTMTGMGGDHYALTGGASPLLGVGMPSGYSFFPYSFFGYFGLAPVKDGSTPNGDAYADVEVYATAHLLMDAVTDPMVGMDGLGAVSGAWNQVDVNETEISDLCQQYGTAMTVGAHTYILPAKYSNAAHTCAYTDPSLPIRLKLPSKPVKKGTAQTLTVATAPHAHLVINIGPGGVVLPVQADGHGKYVYHWTPKSASRTTFIVSAAASSGLAGLASDSLMVR